ncbi:MAG: hypothetical protein WC369_08450, partial [Dehalococcoidales bacterium]
QRHTGGSSDIFFHTTLNRVAEFEKTISEVAAKYGYDTGNIGVYLQPLDRSRAVFLQFGLHYHPENQAEVNAVRELHMAASEAVVNMGGFSPPPMGAGPTWFTPTPRVIPPP